MVSLQAYDTYDMSVYYSAAQTLYLEVEMEVALVVVVVVGV